MKLTLRQAILIRDDYEHIEGEDVQIDGSSFIINSLLIAPFDEKLRSQFLGDFYDKYFGNVDDISLAELLSPKFYTVLALCHYKGSIIHEDIFKVLERKQIELDLSQYGLELHKNAP